MARRVIPARAGHRSAQSTRVPQRITQPRSPAHWRAATVPGVEISPHSGHETEEQREKLWVVTVFDNDQNSYEEVMIVLMVATGCTTEEAYVEAWEIDHLGKCMVHRAPRVECEVAAEIIATIGIEVVAGPEDL